MLGSREGARSPEETLLLGPSAPEAPPFTLKAAPTHIETLSEKHDLRRFDCGDAEINDYLRKTARVDARLLRTTTHVLTYAGEKRVLGFVSTTMGHIHAALDGQTQRPIGVLHVACVGRDQLVRGNAWGKYLLAFAVHQGVRAGREVGCRGVALNCYEPKVAFYESLGFFRYGAGKKDPDTQRVRYPMFFDFLNPEAAP